MPDAKTLAERFPKDFLFGVATASYQVEGAVAEDGRKPSIWDAFSKMPGRVYEGHTGEVACDHYHRLEDDLDLMVSLGIEAYRFSIAWPRIVPEGVGPVNEAGLDFYDRLLDGCRDRGIKTFATLYHWDLPLMLMGDGGWAARSTAHAFERYARIVTARLGDRLDAIATFNEPWCSVWLSHLYGVHAPGERSMDAALAALHTTNLAHGFGVQAIRGERSDLPVGIVYNPMAVIPASDSDEDRAAAERGFDFHNGSFFGPAFKGAYPESFMEAFADRMPAIEPDDMATIAQKLDFIGINYYFPMRVHDDASSDAVFPRTKEGAPVKPEKTDIGWEIDSDGLSFVIRKLAERYDLPDLYITENGACYNMGPDADGIVHDAPRITYLEDHLSVVADLAADGIALKGYFCWSLMDNFEWAEGYKMRFGLVHVNYETLERTPKESAVWYRDLIEAHRTANG
ncbi:GH1 family beta-glucosidase [Pararhizobium mangrovi]|uniref:Beta-glucosidase n=1 Tax=Pararhizobium mangrovi TaxID=2590452 RepID=A0A506UFR7_9HYPH|nr:GH1 family beta-glucosidase [Pararhizobium mangrovi]TPW30697.1 beta-glucosidase [Pararhizobium mangrovi]